MKRVDNLYQNPAIQAAIAAYRGSMEDQVAHSRKIGLLEHRIADLESAIKALESKNDPVETASMTVSEIQSMAREFLRVQSEVAALNSALDETRKNLKTAQDHERYLTAQVKDSEFPVFIAMLDTLTERHAEDLSAIGYCAVRLDMSPMTLHNRIFSAENPLFDTASKLIQKTLETV